MQNKYYRFFYRLWNIILTCFYFLVMNIPLIFTQIFLKYHSPVLMILMTSIFSMALLPSYSSSLRMIFENELSFKKYMHYMKENWSPSYLISMFLTFLFLITRLNLRYFSNNNFFLSILFDILGWVIVLFFFNIASINSRFQFKFGEYFILSILYFKNFFKSSFVSLIISSSILSFCPLKYFPIFMIVFPIQSFLIEDLIKQIENNHTK